MVQRYDPDDPTGRYEQGPKKPEPAKPKKKKKQVVRKDKPETRQQKPVKRQGKSRPNARARAAGRERDQAAKVRAAAANVQRLLEQAQRERVAQLMRQTALWATRIQNANGKRVTANQQAANKARAEVVATRRKSADAVARIQQLMEQRRADIARMKAAAERAEAQMRAAAKIGDEVERRRQALKLQEATAAAAAAAKKANDERIALLRHEAWEKVAAGNAKRLQANAPISRPRTIGDIKSPLDIHYQNTVNRPSPQATETEVWIRRVNGYDVNDNRVGRHIESELEAIRQRQHVSGGNDYNPEELNATAKKYREYADRVAADFEFSYSKAEVLYEQATDMKADPKIRAKARRQYNKLILSPEFKKLTREHRRLFGKNHDGKGGAFLTFAKMYDEVEGSQRDFLAKQYYGGSLVVALRDANYQQELMRVDKTRGFDWFEEGQSDGTVKRVFRQRTLSEEIAFRDRQKQESMEAAMLGIVRDRAAKTRSEISDPVFSEVANYLREQQISLGELRTTGQHGIRGVVGDLMARWDSQHKQRLVADDRTIWLKQQFREINSTGADPAFVRQELMAIGATPEEIDRLFAEGDTSAPDASPAFQRERTEYERRLYAVFGMSPPDLFGRFFSIPVVEGGMNALGGPFAVLGAAFRGMQQYTGEVFGPESGLNFEMFDALSRIVRGSSQPGDVDRLIVDTAKWYDKRRRSVSLPGGFGVDTSREARERARQDWEEFQERMSAVGDDIWARLRVANEFAAEPIRQGSPISSFIATMVADPTNFTPLAVWRYPQRLSYAARVARHAAEGERLSGAKKIFSGVTSFLRVNHETLDLQKRTADLISTLSGKAPREVMSDLRDALANIRTESDVSKATSSVMQQLGLQVGDRAVDQLYHFVESLVIKAVDDAGVAVRRQVDEHAARAAAHEAAKEEAAARVKKIADEQRIRQKAEADAKKQAAVQEGEEARRRLSATQMTDARRVANEEIPSVDRTARRPTPNPTREEPRDTRQAPAQTRRTTRAEEASRRRRVRRAEQARQTEAPHQEPVRPVVRRPAREIFDELEQARRSGDNESVARLRKELSERVNGSEARRERRMGRRPDAPTVDRPVVARVKPAPELAQSSGRGQKLGKALARATAALSDLKGHYRVAMREWGATDARTIALGKKVQQHEIWAKQIRDKIAGLGDDEIPTLRREVDSPDRALDRGFVSEVVHRGGSRADGMWEEEAAVVARYIDKDMDPASIHWVEGSAARHSEEAQQWYEALDNPDPNVRLAGYYNLKQMAWDELHSSEWDYGIRASTVDLATGQPRPVIPGRGQARKPRDWVEEASLRPTDEEEVLRVQSIATEVSRVRQIAVRQKASVEDKFRKAREAARKAGKEPPSAPEPYRQVGGDTYVVYRGDGRAELVRATTDDPDAMNDPTAIYEPMSVGDDIAKFAKEGRIDEWYRALSVDRILRSAVMRFPAWARQALRRTFIREIDDVSFTAFMTKAAEVFTGRGVYEFTRQAEPLFVLFHRMMLYNRPALIGVHDIAFRMAMDEDLGLRQVGRLWLLMESRAGLEIALPYPVVNKMFAETAMKRGLIPELALGMFPGSFRTNVSPHQFSLGEHLGKLVDVQVRASDRVPARVWWPFDIDFPDLRDLREGVKQLAQSGVLRGADAAFDRLVRVSLAAVRRAIREGGSINSVNELRQTMLDQSTMSFIRWGIIDARKGGKRGNAMMREVHAASGSRQSYDVWYKRYIEPVLADVRNGHHVGMPVRDKNGKIVRYVGFDANVKRGITPLLDRGKLPMADAGAHILNFVVRMINAPPTHDWLSRSEEFIRQMDEFGHGDDAAKLIRDIFPDRLTAFRRKILDLNPEMARGEGAWDRVVEAIGREYQTAEGRLWWRSGGLNGRNDMAKSWFAERRIRREDELAEQAELEGEVRHLEPTEEERASQLAIKTGVRDERTGRTVFEPELPEPELAYANDSLDDLEWQVDRAVGVISAGKSPRGNLSGAVRESVGSDARAIQAVVRVGAQRDLAAARGDLVRVGRQLLALSGKRGLSRDAHLRILTLARAISKVLPPSVLEKYGLKGLAPVDRPVRVRHTKPRIDPTPPDEATIIAKYGATPREPVRPRPPEPRRAVEDIPESLPPAGVVPGTSRIPLGNLSQVERRTTPKHARVVEPESAAPATPVERLAHAPAPEARGIGSDGFAQHRTGTSDSSMVARAVSQKKLGMADGLELRGTAEELIRISDESAAATAEKLGPRPRVEVRQSDYDHIADDAEATAAFERDRAAAVDTQRRWDEEAAAQFYARTEVPEQLRDAVRQYAANPDSAVEHRIMSRALEIVDGPAAKRGPVRDARGRFVKRAAPEPEPARAPEPDREALLREAETNLSEMKRREQVVRGGGRLGPDEAYDAGKHSLYEAQVRSFGGDPDRVSPAAAASTPVRDVSSVPVADRLQIVKDHFASFFRNKKGVIPILASDPQVGLVIQYRGRYNSLRDADGAYDNVLHPDPDITRRTAADIGGVHTTHQGGWHYRSLDGSTPGGEVDRLSMSVEGRPEVIDLLDEEVRREGGQMYYKTPTRASGWTGRHDPVTIYFKRPVTDADITRYEGLFAAHKFEPVVPQPGDGPTWLKRNTEPSDSMIRGLVERLNKILPGLGDGTLLTNRSSTGSFIGMRGNDLILSAGQYHALNSIVEELEQKILSSTPTPAAAAAPPPPPRPPTPPRAAQNPEPPPNLPHDIHLVEEPDIVHYDRLMETVRELTGLDEQKWYEKLRDINLRQMGRMRRSSPEWQALKEQNRLIDLALRGIRAEKGAGRYISPQRRFKRFQEAVAAKGDEVKKLIPPRVYAYFARSEAAADVEVARGLHRFLHDAIVVRGEEGPLPRSQWGSIPIAEWEQLNGLVTRRIQEARDGRTRTAPVGPRYPKPEMEPTTDMLRTKRDTDRVVLQAKRDALREWEQMSGRHVSMATYDRMRTLLEPSVGRGRRAKIIIRDVTAKGGDFDADFLAQRLRMTEEDALKVLGWMAHNNPHLTNEELVELMEHAWGMDGTLRTDPIQLTEFDEYVLKEYFHLLTGARYDDEIAASQALAAHGTRPPTDLRYDFRTHQVNTGAWNPRDEAQILSGKKTWALDDERNFWMANYRMLPSWLSDPSIDDGRLFNSGHDFYREMNVKWGNFDRTLAQNARLTFRDPKDLRRDIARGNESLGIRAKRDWEQERRYAIERYGSRVWDGEKMTAMPWLMNAEELAAYASKGGLTHGLMADPDAIAAFNKAVAKVIAKRQPKFLKAIHEANWDARIRGENPGAVVVTSADIHEFAFDVLSEAMATHLFRRRDLVAHGLSLWSSFWRALTMSQIGFTVSNVVDSYVKGSVFSFNRRAVMTSSEVGRRAIPNLEVLGEGEFTTLIYDHSRSLSARLRGETTYGWRDRGGALLDAISYGLANKFARPAENANKLRIAQDLYSGYMREVGERLLKELGDPDAVDLAVKKLVKDELNRLFPNLAKAGPLEKFLNQLSPFISYNFKNQIVWLREAFAHPWMLAFLRHGQMAMEKYNEEEWEKAHPGTTMPDHLRHLIPLGDDLFFDVAIFTDSARGLRATWDTDQKLSEHIYDWFRFLSPQQWAAVNAVTDSLGITGKWMWVRQPHKDGSPSNRWERQWMPAGTPWTGQSFQWDDLFWVLEAGQAIERLGKDGQISFRDSLLIASRLSFFKEFAQPDPNMIRANLFFKMSREEQIIYMKTDEGRELQEWFKANDFLPRDFVIPDELGIDPATYFDGDQMRKDWFKARSQTYRDRVLDGYAALQEVEDSFRVRIAAHASDPFTDEVRNLKLERRAAIVSVYARYPELVMYEVMGKNDKEWAEQKRDWQIDDEIDQFNRLFGSDHAPQRGAFKSDIAYQKARKAWEETRDDYLREHPGVGERLDQVRSGVDAARRKVQAVWGEVLEDFGRRQRIIKAAKEREDWDAVEKGYFLNDLGMQVLERESFGRGWSPYLPNTLSVIRDFNLNRLRGATPGEREAMDRDRALRRLVNDSKVNGKIDWSVWYRKMKNHPDLLEHYLTKHPEKRKEWERNTAYLDFWGRQHRLAERGRWGDWWESFDSAPAWIRDRYYDANPEKRREHARNATYMGYMERWMRAMDRSKRAGFDFFDKMPDWVQDRYFSANPESKMRRFKGYGGSSGYSRALDGLFDLMDAGRWDAADRYWDNMPKQYRDLYLRRNPGSGLADGIGSDRRPGGRSYGGRSFGRSGGKSLSDGEFKQYMGYMDRWVKMLQSGDKQGANDFFRSMPDWVQDFYIRQHPDKDMLRYEDDLVRRLSAYFAADEAHQAQMLAGDRELVAWLHAHDDESERINAILFAYSKLPDDEWIKRTYRERYPEVFSPEARGQRRIEDILKRLGEHPEFADEWVKMLEQIWATAAETVKLITPRAKYWTVKNKKRRRKHSNTYSAAEISERVDDHLAA